MVFSSSVFLLLFLPIVIAIYYNPVVKARSFRNVFLLLASLAFYAWGEPVFVFIMFASIAVNWMLALNINKAKLVIAIALDIGLLFVFKYANFTAGNLGLVIPKISLPIGISFFTFQMLSYMIDVYRGKAQPQKNFLNCALYISLFPQLVAGPIVRYTDIEKQINNRKETWDDFSEGLKRFMVGLGKKLLIANNCALAADAAFDSFGNGVEIGTAFAWLGAVAYTLQIFFDFSGYSDMAIGLGRMFGFKFLENFNYPYISASITEFWRRWHISLSSWFRDYVYIPLGGSRVGKKSRLFFNLLAVWLLTGVWHGANWTFIAWGLGYFVFLASEKFVLPIEKFPKPLAHIYTMLIVICLWVAFRANSLGDAADYYAVMFGGSLFISEDFWFYLNSLKLYFAFSILFCFPIVKKQLPSIAYIVLFILCFMSVVKGGYNPFIYFNF